MNTFDFIRSHALALPPLTKFAIGMAIIFGVPVLCRRVGLVGHGAVPARRQVAVHGQPERRRLLSPDARPGQRHQDDRASGR